MEGNSERQYSPQEWQTLTPVQKQIHRELESRQLSGDWIKELVPEEEFDLTSLETVDGLRQTHPLGDTTSRQLQTVLIRVNQEKTFEEIGQEIGVSKSRARDAYKSGLRNLQIFLSEQE